MELQNLRRCRQLGRGAYGDVWLVQATSPSAMFVLKIISRESIVSKGSARHVFSEKDALSILAHPNVMRLVTTFKDDVNLYFLTEFIPGAPLHLHLRSSSNGHFEVERCRFYTAQIASAVHYVHSMGFVHRDLKASNILLDRRTGHLKLIDFGFCKRMDTQASSRCFTICGTRHAMAPEVFAGTGYSFAADWWSLGVLVFEMLTGQPPFGYHDTTTSLEDLIQGGIESVVFPARLPAAAIDFIKQLCQHDPAHRLGSRSFDELRGHPFFHGFSWDNGSQRPPEFDRSLGEEEDDEDEVPLTEEQQQAFRDF